MVNQASAAYGGEVKITLTGHATAHLLLMSTRLPFSVDEYYMAKEPALQYTSSRWVDMNRQIISSGLVYDQVQIEVSVKNPTRKQTITSSIKVVVSRDIFLLPDEKVKEDLQSVTLSPGSTDTNYVGFTPTQESGYHFDVFIDGEKVYTQPNDFPPRLQVSKGVTSLTLDELWSHLSAGSTYSLTGKLIRADTGEGVSGATIEIYDSDIEWDDLL
ncbi:unnamed protein product, partial [marine sediment metagenome]